MPHELVISGWCTDIRPEEEQTQALHVTVMSYTLLLHNTDKQS